MTNLYSFDTAIVPEISYTVYSIQYMNNRIYLCEIVLLNHVFPVSGVDEINHNRNQQGLIKSLPTSQNTTGSIYRYLIFYYDK